MLTLNQILYGIDSVTIVLDGDNENVANQLKLQYLQMDKATFSSMDISEGIAQAYNQTYDEHDEEVLVQLSNFLHAIPTSTK